MIAQIAKREGYIVIVRIAEIVVIVRGAKPVGKDKTINTMLRGYIVFLAILFVGLYMLYDPGNIIQRQPFIIGLFANFPSQWTYYNFIGFWFFFIIIPISFWWTVIRPIPSVKQRGFHRG